jgi:hypothetical protein
MDEAIEKKISFDSENVIGILFIVVILIRSRVEHGKMCFLSLKNIVDETAKSFYRTMMNNVWFASFDFEVDIITSINIFFPLH